MLAMMKRLAALSALLVLGGCQAVPQSEIDATRAAIDEAVRAGADLRPETSLEEARAALDSALWEIERQGEKTGLLRSYDEARALLQHATEQANRAKLEAEKYGSELRRSSEELMSDARAALDAAIASVNSAPGGKGTRFDLAAMRTDLDDLGNAMSEAQRAFDGGDYVTAQSRAESVKARAAEISKDVATARSRKRAT